MGDAGMLSSGESATPGKALSVQAGTGSGCFQIRTKISGLLEPKVGLILIGCTLPVEGNYVIKSTQVYCDFARGSHITDSSQSLNLMRC